MVVNECLYGQWCWFIVLTGSEMNGELMAPSWENLWILMGDDWFMMINAQLMAQIDG